MPWKIVPLTDSLQEYRARWDELNQSLYGGHPLFHSDFVEALLRHFRSGDERLCVHSSGGRIDGLLIARPASRFKWALYAPSQWQACPLLVEDASCLSTLVNALPGFVAAIDLLCQDPQYSPQVDQLASRIKSSDHAHTIAIDLCGTADDYWKDKRRKDIGKNITRRARRLREQGSDVSLIELTDAQNMVDAVRRFGELESAGWKAAAGTAVHPCNAQGRFYAEVMQSYARRGNSSMYQLQIDGTTAAMRLCIRSESMIVFLKTTYDESLAKFSPGRLITYLVLESEFQRQRSRVIEYYTNADQDLFAWGTTDRWISHRMLFRVPIVRRLYEMLK